MNNQTSYLKFDISGCIMEMVVWAFLKILCNARHREVRLFEQ